MDNIKSLYKRLDSSEVSLIAARVGEKLPMLISNIILHFGLDKKRKITVYTDTDIYWLQSHLLGQMTKVAPSNIRNYLEPCYYKMRNGNIDSQSLLESMETLRASDILIQPLKRVENYTNYILENEKNAKSDIVIIYQIEAIFKNGYLSPKEYLDQLKKLPKKGSKLILVAGVDREVEETEEYNFENIRYYREMKPYVDETVLLYSTDYTSTISRKMTIKMNDTSFNFTIDRETEQINCYGTSSNKGN